jgi:hypothetical protein
VEIHSSQTTYNSSLTSKGALIDETLEVFRLVDSGLSKEEIKHKVIQDGLAGGDTHGTRESIWADIHTRYFSDNPRLPLIAQYILSIKDKNAQKLILFYELCQSSSILYDVTIYCVYPRYLAGFSKIGSEIIMQYMDHISEDHPEIESWSNSTKKKLARNLLTVLRDFGLLIGKNNKEFHRVFVPMTVFSYILHYLLNNNVTSPHAIIKADDWKLLFLDKVQIISLLNEASKRDLCNFKKQGDMMTIDFIYSSWEEFVAKNS